MAEIIWKGLVFTSTDIRTDLSAYRRYSQLLIPLHGEEHRFLALCNNESVVFYLGSTTPGGTARLTTFFTSVYPSYAQDERPELDGFGTHCTLRNSYFNRNAAPFFYPDFLSSLIFAARSSISGRIAYQVVLRSRMARFSGRLHHSFVVSIGVSGSEEEKQFFLHLVAGQAYALKKNHRWRMHSSLKAAVLFREDVFRLADNLVNFIRIPSDQDQ